MCLLDFSVITMDLVSGVLTVSLTGADVESLDTESLVLLVFFCRGTTGFNNVQKQTLSSCIDLQCLYCINVAGS